MKTYSIRGAIKYLNQRKVHFELNSKSMKILLDTGRLIPDAHGFLGQPRFTKAYLDKYYDELDQDRWVARIKAMSKSNEKPTKSNEKSTKVTVNTSDKDADTQKQHTVQKKTVTSHKKTVKKK